MSGQRLHCDVCGWSCNGEKGMTLEDAHSCPGPPKRPPPPMGDSAVAASYHALDAHSAPNHAPVTEYEKVEGYDPEACPAETTLRSDEHRLAQCKLPKGHLGAHRDPALQAEWTDSFTLFEETVAGSRSAPPTDPNAPLRAAQEALQEAARAIPDGFGPLPYDQVQLLARLDASVPTMTVDDLWRTIQRLAQEVLRLRNIG